jgi:hypothetical protein
LELAISVLIAGAIITFIAIPLFSSSHKPAIDQPSALETILSQRDAAYDALRDLDLDFQTGKLSETDYTTLREKYKSRAATILQQIDATQRQQSEALEKEIAEMRAAKHAQAIAAAQEPDDIEKEIAKRRGKPTTSNNPCQNCGAPLKPQDQFCAKCGTHR